eukprot:3115475-Pyramimonas_sp.AAC.1
MQSLGVHSVGIGTFNVHRSNWNSFQSTLYDIDRLFKGVLMVQECSSWPPDAEFSGWSLIHQSSCLSAVIVPRELMGSLRDSYADQYFHHQGVLLGDFGIVSAYLPDISKSLDAFMTSLASLSALAESLRQGGARYFIFGGDLQVELGADIGSLTGSCALGRRRGKHY